ncbi:MAG TPA: energy transducer TonB [Gammaproteobacteria bacterium]
MTPAAGFAQPAGSGAGNLLDPIGVWSCVLYGNPALGEERVLLSFAPDQTVRTARHQQQGTPVWASSSRWEIQAATLEFTDSRSGRRFSADLTRARLGGEWRTLNLLGGWWCSPADDVDLGASAPGSAAADTENVISLIPEVMATPTYPIQAIREAKEGRVVLCFVVRSSGEVFDPEFLELSDEIFRAPSLDALMRSRYQAWDSRRGESKPACRSFIYRLDYVF